MRPVVVAGLRAPVGTAGHSLNDVPVDGLAAAVLTRLRAWSSEAGLINADVRNIDDVIMGNCLGPGGNPARVAALRAGLGVDVPGVSVDRQCGSGLEAIIQGAVRIQVGSASLIMAGGAESASTAPWRFWPPTDGAVSTRYTRAPFAPSGYPDPEMGPAADDLADRLGISRARQDEWAARSFERAWAAQQDGRFTAELIPVAGQDHDERVRPGMSVERLARLRPVFGPSGTATAGNSCGISDGAAFVAITTEDAWSRTGLPGLRIVDHAVSAGDPASPGLGAGFAIERLLSRTGVAPADLEAVEITEAFASQVIAAVDQVGLNEDVVCADGGAIAYGHPWGASGAILVVRLFSRLLSGAHGSGLGLAACAIGGGQGLALLVERVG